MARRLVVAVAQLTDAHRSEIRAAATRHGFEALFFDAVEDALPAAEAAEVLLTDSPRLAQAARALRWVCTPAAGVDAFVVPGALPRGAMLSNSSGAYGVTIAEHIVMVTLELMRRQRDYDAIVARRAWRRDLAVRSILGCRTLILGTGDIGREAAVRLRAFRPARLVGLNRSGYNPGGLFDRCIAPEALDDALPEADLVVLCLPATEATRRLLDARRLSMLHEGAILVNVGRGSAVDQSALERLLRAGRLSAALDVFEEEPLPPGHGLWSCPNLLITPHVAGNMTLPYTLDRIAALFLEDFDNYCAGRPLARRVDPAKGY